MSRGSLFIISAPSGAGKTTVLHQVMADTANLAFSVSHTTRKPRAGEQDGRDYHFVSQETFKEMAAENRFLEWAKVHDNFYGTSRAAVETELEAGRDIILDIDVQGASQVRMSGLAALSIFILPPSLAVLEDRLRGRATDSESTIALRLNNARQEMAEARHYDHLIVNDSLAEAATMLRAVILAERSRTGRGMAGAPISLPA